MEHEEWKGPSVLENLAQIYRQLYLRPGEVSPEEYKKIVNKGMEPEVKDLSHFRCHPQDRCLYENTPAGEVMVVTLNQRQDFELFLQIMANRCVPYEVPSTQGASIIDGLINWTKIQNHRTKFMISKRASGDTDPDWNAEFKRFTADKKNYNDTVIVLCAGPYSGIKSEQVGMPETEWLNISMKIRRVHECTHFVCRRLYPEKKDTVWDELVADAAGIYAALGRYDLKMAELFLGITETGYTGGRLQNYTGNEDIDNLAMRVHSVLSKIDKVILNHEGVSAYDMVLILEDKKEELWDAD